MLADVLSRFWWMTLVRGVLWLLFGLAVVAQPAASLVTLVVLFGVFALADGIGNIVSAIGRQEADNRWVLALIGLSGIGAGVLTLFNPGVTALALLFYVAVWAIATGLLQFVAAIRLRHEIKGEFWLALSGLVSIAFGVYLMARPGEGVLSVIWLIGIYALALGIILIALALRARGFVRRAMDSVPRPALR